MKHYIWVCLWEHFWERLLFQPVNWIRKLHPQCGQTSSNWFRAQKNKEAEKRKILSLFCSWDTILLPLDVRSPGSLAFGIWGLYQLPLSVSRAFGLCLRVIPSASLVHLPLDLDWFMLQRSLGLPLSGVLSWDFSASIRLWGLQNFPNKFSFLYLSILSLPSLCRSLTNTLLNVS